MRRSRAASVVLSLLAGAGLLLAGRAPVVAQEATPVPVAPGEGMAEILAVGRLEAVPPGPVVVDLIRATFPPGSTTPPGPDPGPSLVSVEQGALSFELEGPASLTTAATPDTTPPGPAPVEGGVTLYPGDSLLIPAETGFRAFNDGSEPAVALVGRVYPPVPAGPGTPPALAGTPPAAGSPVDYVTLVAGVAELPPPTPAALVLARLNYPAGAADPAPSENAGPLLAYVDEGTIGYTVVSRQSEVYRSRGGGSPEPATLAPERAEPGVEVTLRAGDAVFEAHGTVSAARNAGSEPAGVLILTLVPAEAIAAATMTAALPAP